LVQVAVDFGSIYMQRSTWMYACVDALIADQSILDRLAVVLFLRDVAPKNFVFGGICGNCIPLNFVWGCRLI